MNPLRQIPKIDKLISDTRFEKLNKKLLTRLTKEHIDRLRASILAGEIDSIDSDKLIADILHAYQSTTEISLKPLINATGVILHTNMGRSLISKEILDRASKVICHYSNLEYDQPNGCRGERYEHLTKQLKSLLGVEDVLVVNNNASAVFLILNTFAKDSEVIVSRGELVEIGGSFRIPEVMSNSGAILKEVGATNKTKLSDYSNAISEDTTILMKVHKSNYTIEGFSQEVDFSDIQALASQSNLIDYYDLGSGYIPKLPYGLSQVEPPIADILTKNPSLVSFSGDKLFGSVQAGIIVGKKELIDRLKQNQLLRMLRVDKITLSILEETTRAYLEERYDLIPTLDMLYADMDRLRDRAIEIVESFDRESYEIVVTTTYMGGGTLPNREFESIAIHIIGKATELEREFRLGGVIGRIDRDRFLLDVRTILSDDIEPLKALISKVIR